MDNFLLSQLIYGPLILVVSILYRAFPPKNINSLYGYRTTRSMKSTEAWEYSNKLSANLFLLASMLTIFAQVIFNMTLQKSEIQTYSAATLILFIVLTIPFTEIRLRKNFDENGVRKG